MFDECCDYENDHFENESFILIEYGNLDIEVVNVDGCYDNENDYKYSENNQYNLEDDISKYSLNINLIGRSSSIKSDRLRNKSLCENIDYSINENNIETNKVNAFKSFINRNHKFGSLHSINISSHDMEFIKLLEKLYLPDILYFHLNFKFPRNLFYYNINSFEMRGIIYNVEKDEDRNIKINKFYEEKEVKSTNLRNFNKEIFILGVSSIILYLLGVIITILCTNK